MIGEAVLARRLAVSRRTVRQWRQYGTGPPWYSYESGTVRYAWPEVVAWLAKCRRPGEPIAIRTLQQLVVRLTAALEAERRRRVAATVSPGPADT